MEKNDKVLPPVYITVLGGLGEVGKNMLAIEMDDEMWIVDAGIKFADENKLIDGIIPNMEYLKKNEKKIKGLIITHGHEDHIGAVPHLVNAVNIPKIYAGKLAANMIFSKLKERETRRVKTEIIDNKYIIKSKHFLIQFANVTHSIPDAYSVLFKTKQGTIFHTGDFKFDLTPVGTSADIHKMSKWGKEGVDVMLSDSTNSLNSSWSKSESEVSRTIEKIVKESKDRIIIGSFSSNIYRVREILKIGVQANRKIAVFGYSMEKNIKISTRIKYINVPKEKWISTKEIKDYKKEEVLILCTGTQGEPNAALTKMVENKLRKEIEIGKGDTVIFASSAIPGNFEAVEKLKNKLIKCKVNIIDNKINPGVHASGHAGIDEQKLMFSLIKPKNFVPVHGETYMLKKHEDTSKIFGVGKKSTFILQNGGKVKMIDGKISYSGTVPSGDIFVDSSSLSGQSMKVVSDREIMSTNGVVTVSIVIDSKQNKTLSKPKLSTRGTFEVNSNKALVELVQDNVEKALKEYYDSGEKIRFGNIKDIIKSTAEITILEKKRVSPIVVPIILNRKDKE